MQSYFDPTRKTTSKKNGRRPTKKIKNEDNLKKNKKTWRQPQKNTWKMKTTSKNEKWRQPQKNKK